MPVQFSVLASGSRGNATLIRAGGAGVLIDLGLGPRAMAARLAAVDASWDCVSAALLTHTHSDHVGDVALAWLAKRMIPLLCHEGHRATLESLTGFQALEAKGLVRHYDERPFLAPTGMRVEPITLSHDGGPTFGFRLETRLNRRTKTVALGYVADTGCWWDGMADCFANVDALGIEFNHDVELQRQSGRSPYLIARNLGDGGHLSNDQGAGLLTAILDRSHSMMVRDVVLLHLSHDCNRPEVALGVASEALRQSGRRAQLYAATQDSPHPNLAVFPRGTPEASARRDGAPETSRPWEAA
jgi:phosphoribosyl 1,2-cyclic phosphodiesterase